MAGMTTAAIIVSAVSSVAQAANAYQNYQTQANAAQANANIAANNSRAVLTQGVYAQDQKQKEGQQYISNQHVRNLQAGAAGAGTTGDRAVAKSAYNLEKDLDMIAYNYQAKATDYLNQSKMYKYEGEVAKANAANALVAGGLNVGNSLLAGVGNKVIAGQSVGGVDSNTAAFLAKPTYARNSKLWL